ncbi:hypothetical protein Tco_0295185 [Tanacetum coccineum]
MMTHLPRIAMHGWEYAMAVRDFKELLLKEEARLFDNPMTTKRTSEKSRKREGKIEDASSVVIQITSLVIALKTLPVIKRHSLLEVGAIVEMTQRKKRVVAWLKRSTIR